jgi:hypothetical protein
MAKEDVIKCDRCNRLFHSYSVAHCTHEAVNKYYGKRICMYCCMKCKHHTKDRIGVGCELKN